MLAWNINGVQTHERELSRLLMKFRPDIIVFSETRGDAEHTTRRVWPGEKVDQVLQIRNNGITTRAGVAVITTP